MFCYALLCVHYSLAIILVGKREMVALLCLSSGYLVIVVGLFLAVPRVCLQFVIMVFPDHTHYFLNHLVIVSTAEDHSEESVYEETKRSFFEAFVKVSKDAKSLVQKYNFW